MLILDSNTISYYFRGDPQVVPRIQAVRPGSLGVPAVVAYELRYGLMRLPKEAAEPRLAALAQFLRPMQMLPFDDECASQAAKIRIALEAAGTPIGPHDTLIAATAMRHQATTGTTTSQPLSPE
jgi:tRNA(fMet)-specific endonuclease VapC